MSHHPPVGVDRLGISAAPGYLCLSRSAFVARKLRANRGRRPGRRSARCTDTRSCFQRLDNGNQPWLRTAGLFDLDLLWSLRRSARELPGALSRQIPGLEFRSRRIPGSVCLALRFVQTLLKEKRKASRLGPQRSTALPYIQPRNIVFWGFSTSISRSRSDPLLARTALSNLSRERFL
jgi:hypothetical protein